MAYETIEVEPLSPVIGAEIRGLDLSRPLGRRHSAVTSASCTSTRPHHPLQAIRRF